MQIVKQTVVWTIAGFDPSSGAGMTADLLPYAAHALFGCSGVTGITVQSTRGVLTAEAVRSTLLSQTLEHLYADLPPPGIKIVMLGSAENLTAVAEFLSGALRSRKVPVVLDPVSRSSSGRDLFPAHAAQRMRAELLPLVDFVTPNWGELALLSGSPVQDLSGAGAAAGSLLQANPNLHVVATGGDQAAPVDVLLMPGGSCVELSGTHIHTEATHGTGCAFSSALLSRLVLGDTPEAACRAAKSFVANAMRNAPGLGGGKGPLDLLWPFHASATEGE